LKKGKECDLLNMDSTEIGSIGRGTLISAKGE
jgi:hypothetical protein